MAEYETIDVKEMKYGQSERKFLEVARKKIEDSEFISVSKGYYTHEGQKRYKNAIGFPDEDELKNFLIESLQAV